MFYGNCMAHKKNKLFLNEVSLDTLMDLYKNETHPKAKIRLLCAILRKKDKTEAEISEVTNMPIQTVSDTLKRFEQRGLEGRYSIKQKGQPQKLTPKQRNQIKRILAKSPMEEGLPFVVWTSKLVQYIIKKKFKIGYVLRQIYNLMRSFGFSIQRPRLEHIKANKQLQSEFKKNFDEELENLLKQDMRSSFWMRVSSH